MRPTQFSTETLRTFLKEKHIATMKQLKKALNTNIDMTIYRKLKQLSYHTSYSHKGKFYTLDEIATFNEKGLWKYDIARFSKYGTLMETVKAFIVLKEGETLTEEQIVDYCKERLAAYKVPKIVEFVEDLPKSTVGKILRREVRDLELSRAKKS